MDGFSAKKPPSERWLALAREKLTEVEALIEGARSMKRLLERGLRCECLDIENCALLEEERWSAAPSLSLRSGQRPPSGAITSP